MMGHTGRYIILVCRAEKAGPGSGLHIRGSGGGCRRRGVDGEEARAQTRRRSQGSREIFCDFDLDIAEVALAGCALALLFVWVAGLGGSGWAALEAAVPVVRDEELAFVFLGGAVGVDIVDVGEVGLESKCII